MLLKSKHHLFTLASIVFLLSALVLTACGNKNTQTNEAAEILPTAEMATATPIPADRAVLIAAADADTALVAEAQTLLAELSAASGLEFETRQEITSETLTADIKIIVFLQHPDNLGTLAANAPGTQFVALSNLDWSPPANVTLIHEDNNDTAFLAGYIAAILAPNFRVGALLAAENTELNQAFQNGVNYYCGICASLINPLNTYPVVSIQPSASTAETWQAAFNEINLNKVNVLYVTREAMTSQLLAYLSGMDVAIISNQTPLDEGRARWAGSIYLDGLSPIREIWNDLLAGVGGRIVNANFKITDIQQIIITDGSVWLSPGKLQLVDTIIQLLREDQINTQTVN